MSSILLFTLSFEGRVVREEALFFSKLINRISILSVDPLSAVIEDETIVDTFGLDATSNLLLCFNERKLL